MRRTPFRTVSCAVDEAQRRSPLMISSLFLLPDENIRETTLSFRLTAQDTVAEGVLRITDSPRWLA